jgi:glutathione synthase/RimK-type ligase-like ATP-grasp enzyme
MKRQARAGEFRANLHRGGTASVIRITPEERSTAVRAAKTMGLNVAGVDMLRSNHGPVVMEVNSNRGCDRKGSRGHDRPVHRGPRGAGQDAHARQGLTG